MTVKPFTAAVIVRAIRARRLYALSATEQAKREAIKIIDTLERSSLK